MIQYINIIDPFMAICDGFPYLPITKERVMEMKPQFYAKRITNVGDDITCPLSRCLLDILKLHGIQKCNSR